MTEEIRSSDSSWGWVFKTALVISLMTLAAVIIVAMRMHHETELLKIESEKAVDIATSENRKSEPYQFHYAGKEQYVNAYNVYRFNKETGEVFRFTHVNFDKAEDGTPPHAEVRSVNLGTGEDSVYVPESELGRLIEFWNKQDKKESEQKTQKAPSKDGATKETN